MRNRLEEIKDPFSRFEVLEFCDELDALPDALQAARDQLIEISGKEYAAFWFKDRLAHLEGRRQLVRQGKIGSRDQHGWHHIDLNFLNSLKPPNAEVMRAYLHGREVDWAIAFR